MNNKIKTIVFSVLYPLFYLRYLMLKRNYPNVKNTISTLKLLRKSGKSLARFGDGEFNLIYGGKIGFQDNDKSLCKDLERVLKSPNYNCLIGIPDVFHDLSRFRFDAKSFWLYSVVKNWNKWKYYFRKDYTYVDSLCSRFYMDYKDKSIGLIIIEEWKKLWNNRNIVIVEGEYTKMGVGNDLFNNCKNIKRVICPSRNAYSIYSSILKICKNFPKDTLFIIALGPTASVLAYDLAALNFQAIDTGHLDLEYNWMKNKSKNKEAVNGRFVNEISKNNLSYSDDSHYSLQIVANFCK